MITKFLARAKNELCGKTVAARKAGETEQTFTIADIQHSRNGNGGTYLLISAPLAGGIKLCKYMDTANFKSLLKYGEGSDKFDWQISLKA